MPGALPLWGSQSTPHQGEGRDSPSAPLPCKRGGEGRATCPWNPHHSWIWSCLPVPDPLNSHQNHLLDSQRWGRGSVCPSASSRLSAEISAFFPQIRPCNIRSSAFVREMLFIRIRQTLLSVYFMHYLLQSPETNATPVPVIYCIWVSQADP